MDDFVAVFNSTKPDVAAARIVVLSELGVDAWDSVKKRKRSGIMEVFTHPPTDATRLFVKTVADRVRKRLSPLNRLEQP